MEIESQIQLLGSCGFGIHGVFGGFGSGSPCRGSGEGGVGLVTSVPPKNKPVCSQEKTKSRASRSHSWATCMTDGFLRPEGGNQVYCLSIT